MNREVKKISVMLGLFSLWIFLFQGIDLAKAKDPDYPTKPIELYIHLGSGSTDLASRALIDAANKHLSQPIIPINKPGGGGAVTVMAIKTAKPDGYTIGTLASSQAFVLPFSEGAPYKDLKGFTWIANFGAYINPILVRADAPWKTWKDFIEWARKNPRGAKVGITAAKTADYKGLILWQVEQRENVEFSYLTFKGSGEIISALLGGHINLYASTVDITTMSFVTEGKIRLLSYTGLHKVPGFQDIPSIEEMYGFEKPDLLAIIGPPGLPDYVVKTIEGAFSKAVRDPNFIKIMNRMYMPIAYMEGANLVKYVDEIFSKTAKIYEGVKAEELKRKK